MKRIFTLILACLALAVEAATVKVGYTKSEGDEFWAYDGFGNTAVDMRFGAAIRITPEMYANYIGAKIVGLRVGWSNPDYSTPCTIFMRSELNGKDNILSGSGTLSFVSAGSYRGKYKQINFDDAEGMTLTEDLGTFYVGYYAEQVKAQTYCIATSYPANQPGSAYVFGDIESNYDSEGREIWDDESKQSALCIDLIVEGTFTNKVELRSIINLPTTWEGKASDALVDIKNCGTNDVNRLTFEYAFGDTKKTESITLSETLSPGGIKRVAIPCWGFGDGEHTLRLTKVGGMKNNIADTLRYQTTMVPDDVASQYERTSLVEFYQSEGVYYVPRYYDEYFKPGFEQYAKRLNIVAQHLDDQWMMGDDDETRLMLDMCDNDSMAVILPAVSLDRTGNLALIAMGLESAAPYHSIILPDFAYLMYEPQLERPTFARIDAKCKVVGDKAVVTLSGNIAPGVLADGKRLHLSAYLLEDDVYTDSQEQDELGKGDYYHDNLQRARLTSLWGDALDVESGEFSVEYTTDFYPEEWNAGKMRVVAFLNRTPEDGGRWNRDIINSTSCPVEVSGEDGIQSVQAEAGSLPSAIYDLQGRRVANAARSGFYIVNGRKAIKK